MEKNRNPVQGKAIQGLTLKDIPADMRKRFEAGEQPTEGRAGQLYKLWKAAGGRSDHEARGTVVSFTNLTELRQYAKAHAAAVLAGDDPHCPGFFVRRFRAGSVACDEPPGFEERAYELWKAAGGVPDPPKPVTADDL